MAALAKKKRAQPAAAISAADAKRAQNSSYIPLKIRFKAWWEGVDAATLMRRMNKAQQKKVSADIKIDKPIDDTEANKTEFEVLTSIRERVWGKDLIVPGGPDYVSEFLADAKLSPGKVILDLSAGLGGSGRALAVALDVLVEGYEMDEAVAKVGAARASHLALEAQAPVSHYFPHNIVLRVGRYDCVYAHEAFFRILDKQNMLAEVWKSLTEEGHFIFTDLVYGPEGSVDTAEVKACIDSERDAFDPWTEEDYRNHLAEAGFQIQSFEDKTAWYQGVIRDAWTNFSETLDETTINRRFVDVMMFEAKIWQCRMQALKAGHLRFIRVHAIRPKPNIR